MHMATKWTKNEIAWIMVKIKKRTCFNYLTSKKKKNRGNKWNGSSTPTAQNQAFSSITNTNTSGGQLGVEEGEELFNHNHLQGLK